jgi:8-oxo-dGTP diphosphatase
MKRIRNSAKAIIIRDGNLLAIHKKDQVGGYFILPGGGQHHGEPLIETVKREVMEETTLDVSVCELRYIRDYISENHEFADTEKDAHQVEFMFTCTVAPNAVPRLGDTPDTDQIDVQWLPLERLMDYRLYPLTLRPHLMAADEQNKLIYLGDIN